MRAAAHQQDIACMLMGHHYPGYMHGKTVSPDRCHSPCSAALIQMLSWMLRQALRPRNCCLAEWKVRESSQTRLLQPLQHCDVRMNHDVGWYSPAPLRTRSPLQLPLLASAHSQLHKRPWQTLTHSLLLQPVSHLRSDGALHQQRALGRGALPAQGGQGAALQACRDPRAVPPRARQPVPQQDGRRPGQGHQRAGVPPIVSKACPSAGWICRCKLI